MTDIITQYGKTKPISQWLYMQYNIHTDIVGDKLFIYFL